MIRETEETEETEIEEVQTDIIDHEHEEVVIDEDVHEKRRSGGFDTSDEAHMVFKSVDRDSEDLLVKTYKTKGGERILHDLYMLREPTLKVWARRHSYLGDSEEDVFADLRTVWMECIAAYKYEPSWRAVRTKSGGFVLDDDGNKKTVFKRTTFNTFFYTSLRNYISNVIKKKYAKKRLDDSGVPLEGTMMSLDYSYGGDEGEGDGDTMYSLLADDKVKKVDLDADHIIDDISKGDQDIKKALQGFVQDIHLKRLSTACRLCKGVLPLSRSSKSILMRGGDAGHNLLRGMITFTGKYGDDFSITSYAVMKDRVSYEVYGQDTKLFRKVMKAVEQYRARIMKKTIENSCLN